jgi:hypothetical protein
MQKKVNTHCAQFNTLLTALKLANNVFYLIGLCRKPVYGVLLNHESKMFYFSFLKVLAGLIWLTWTHNHRTGKLNDYLDGNVGKILSGTIIEFSRIK